MAGIYLVGLLFCIFSIVALRAQRKFYLSARDQKKRFENELGLGEQSITPVERSHKKIQKLTTFKAFVDLSPQSIATSVSWVCRQNSGSVDTSSMVDSS